MKNPFFTIVTSTLNSLETIDRCLDSVKQQTFRNYEHIIIDGNSSDGTFEYLKAREGELSVLISEPDSGIYDAWNKALKYSRGEWLLFLGSDDILADNGVLSDVYNLAISSSTSSKIIYGDVEQLTPRRLQYVRTVTIPRQLIGTYRLSKIGVLPLLPPHPATFHHRSLFSEYGTFDDTYKILGDAKFILQYVVDPNREDPNQITYARRVLNKHTLGGVSATLYKEALHESLRIVSDLNLKVSAVRKYLSFLMSCCKILITKILGNQVGYQLINLIRKIQL